MARLRGCRRVCADEPNKSDGSGTTAYGRWNATGDASGVTAWDATTWNATTGDAARYATGRSDAAKLTTATGWITSGASSADIAGYCDADDE